MKGSTCKKNKKQNNKKVQLLCHNQYGTVYLSHKKISQVAIAGETDCKCLEKQGPRLVLFCCSQHVAQW